MTAIRGHWATPEAYIAAERPEDPVFCLATTDLTRTARQFLHDFPGETAYAVKANPETIILLSLIAAGIRRFDVASPDEIAAVLDLAPEAELQYNNPVKSRAEIMFALKRGVRSFAADSAAEIEKIADCAGETPVSVAVRFRLPILTAAYDFGAKFGAEPARAAELLRLASRLGLHAHLTFHPGSQCVSPLTYAAYIHAAARIAEAAGTPLTLLNVGGGFPIDRAGPDHAPPALTAYFEAIEKAVAEAFGDHAPALVCEPGRAMVGPSSALIARVKLAREDGAVFLNDGVYGGLGEAPVLHSTNRFRVVGPDGRPRTGEPRAAVFFGPTCDSLDRLPGDLTAPSDIAEGDYVIFEAMGAYGSATTTRFNGYAATTYAAVAALG